MIRIKEYYCDIQGPPSMPDVCTALSAKDVHGPHDWGSYWAGAKVSELVPEASPPDKYGGVAVQERTVGGLRRLLCRRCGGTVRVRDVN